MKSITLEQRLNERRMMVTDSRRLNGDNEIKRHTYVKQVVRLLLNLENYPYGHVLTNQV